VVFCSFRGPQTAPSCLFSYTWRRLIVRSRLAEEWAATRLRWSPAALDAAATWTLIAQPVLGGPGSTCAGSTGPARYYMCPPGRHRAGHPRGMTMTSSRRLGRQCAQRGPCGACLDCSPRSWKKYKPFRMVRPVSAAKGDPSHRCGRPAGIALGTTSARLSNGTKRGAASAGASRAGSVLPSGSAAR
jgi:hypothetical protein